MDVLNSGIEVFFFGPSQSKDTNFLARSLLGMVVADHLKKMGRKLLQKDGPLLLKEI